MLPKKTRAIYGYTSLLMLGCAWFTSFHSGILSHGRWPGVLVPVWRAPESPTLELTTRKGNTPNLTDQYMEGLTISTTSALIPVIYVWFANDDATEFPAYAQRCMTVSASNGNLVTVIASPRLSIPADAEKYGVKTYNINQLETNQLQVFRSRYRPWGASEPWERQNTERFFLLSRYMELESLTLLFYADSDVAVLIPISSQKWVRQSPECDGWVSLLSNFQDMSYHSMFWAVWSGSSLLRHDVLSDFTDFAIDIYQEQYIHILEEKRTKWPYVCDMTLWYLFVGASNTELARKWSWPYLQLPNTTQHVFCDILNHGFAHTGGYIKEVSNGELIPLQNSLHFGGSTKNDALLLSLRRA